MAEEVGIVMTLYDRVSPTLKSITGNSKAFDKSLDELEASLKAYDKAQGELVDRAADLKKALAETDVKVKDAQKSYRKLKDEASKGALDEAIDEQARLRRELNDTEVAIKENSAAYKDLYKSARDAANSISKAENRAGAAGGTGIGTLAKGLAAAGLGKLWSDALGQAGSAMLSSAIGEPEARMASSVLTGAISGGSMGAMLGPPGIAVGAILGGLAGAVSGGSEIFEARDDAFKSYVQEAAQAQISDQTEAISSGSAVAAGREQKQMAFSTLLGSEEAASAFLSEVQDMAAQTNYTYDEITGYAKSLVKPFGAERSLEVLGTLSDASAALSLDESDNSVLIAGLSRMMLTDKTTQEYLNYFSERGVDVYEALSKWGDAAQVAEQVTAGKISGSEAADAILAYMEDQFGGLSEKMAATYEGMADNLADAEANAEAAYGEGYNETRKQGIQDQMDWLNSGVMDEANRAIGAWQAQLENEKERYQREAVEAMMETDEYQQAQAEGDAAKMGELIMRAKVQGMSEYNASEGAQLALESELALAAGIREDAASNQAYWDAGYRKSQEYSKGLAAGMLELVGTTGSSGRSVYHDLGNNRDEEPATGRSVYHDLGYAYGLDRVPYDGYAAILHEGERVQTAREAREEDLERTPTRIYRETLGAVSLGKEDKIQTESQALSTGLASGLLDTGGTTTAGRSGSYDLGYAYGLDRVPYDGYAAILHEGERVQTAREAGETDRNRTPIQIIITGNQFGAGMTAEEIAQRLADALEIKLAAGRVRT